jgi:hypothetical protein
MEPARFRCGKSRSIGASSGFSGVALRRAAQVWRPVFRPSSVAAVYDRR